MDPQPPNDQQPEYPQPYQDQPPHMAYGQPQQSVPPTQPQPTPAQPNPHPANLHPMVVLQPGERVVAVIKRHPFGIVSLYAASIVGILVAVVLAFYFLPQLLDQYGGSDAAPMLYSGLAIV